MKRRVIFRIFPFNRITFPILLNSWEQKGLDREFDIIISEKIVKPIKGDIYLYSFMTPFLPTIYEEIKLINNNNIIIAGGGPHITGDSEISFDIGFDILFKGNGEKSFFNFGIDVLNGKVKKNRQIYNQENYEINEYLPISKYFKTIPPLEITRGCNWNCKYCQTNLRKPIYRSFKSIKNYLDLARQKKLNRINFISPSALEFCSENNGANTIKKIENILVLASEYGFEFIEYGIFPSEIRPKSINEESLKVLKKYVSNKRLTIGAQSGSNERLKQLNRGHTLSDIEKSVQKINQFGFLVNLDFIIGYPDEDKLERQKTFNFIKYMFKNYRIKVQLHHFFPLSGSKLQYRLPSKLSNNEKEQLIEMNRNGIGKNGWIQNELDSDKYFKWLSNTFPGHYKKYK